MTNYPKASKKFTVEGFWKTEPSTKILAKDYIYLFIYLFSGHGGQRLIQKVAFMASFSIRWRCAHTRTHIYSSLGLPLSLLSFGLLVLFLSLTPMVVYYFFSFLFFSFLKSSKRLNWTSHWEPTSQAQWQRRASRTFTCTLVGLNPKPFWGVKSPKKLCTVGLYHKVITIGTVHLAPQVD